MGPVYRFDDIEIDPSNHRVLKAGRPVSIEPKSLSVLTFLIEKRGQLVKKKDLIDAVWGETFVTDNVLSRAIAQLRKALLDDAKETRYIETVPTQGYRFIAEVNVEGENDSHAAVPSKPESGFPSERPAATLPGRSRPFLRRHVIASVAIVAIAAIAIASFRLRLRSVSEPLQIASSTQITTSAGLSIFPTFSPDATEIAYSTDRGKGFEIFVRQLAAGGKEFQVTSDGNQNVEPAWSPDGSLIAYYARKRGGIWIMPAHGGDSRKVADFGSHPAWSRDGQWLAFQSSILDALGSDAVGVGNVSTIWVVRSDGSNLKQITAPGNPIGGQGSPSWSPDSRHVVFVTELNGLSELWAIGADGSGVVRLAALSGGYYDPVYTPDGNNVVYGAFTSGYNSGLWQERISPDTSSPLGPPVQIMNSGGNRIKNLSLSSDGKKLLYASVGLTGSLQSLPVSRLVEPTADPITLTSDVGCREILPAFSPDGSHIAYVSCHGRAGIRQQVWLMSSEGGDIQQMTFPPGTSYAPNWFPDGRRILVNSSRDLISVDVDTRENHFLIKLDANSLVQVLSPDGTQVAFDEIDNGVMNTWVVDIARGKKRQLTFDQEGAGYPAWSPDGKWIAVETQRAAENYIGIIPNSGGQITQLTPLKKDQWSHGWSPDSDKIIYAMPGDDLSGRFRARRKSKSN